MVIENFAVVLALAHLHAAHAVGAHGNQVLHAEQHDRSVAASDGAAPHPDLDGRVVVHGQRLRRLLERLAPIEVAVVDVEPDLLALLPACDDVLQHRLHAHGIGRSAVLDGDPAKITTDLYVADEAFWDLDGPVVRITTPHIPLPASDVLEDLALPSADRIAEKVSRAMNG